MTPEEFAWKAYNDGNEKCIRQNIRGPGAHKIVVGEITKAIQEALASRDKEIEGLKAKLADARREALEEAAQACESPALVLRLPEKPRYEGDEGHTERRVCFALAEVIRALAGKETSTMREKGEGQ